MKQETGDGRRESVVVSREGRGGANNTIQIPQIHRALLAEIKLKK